MLLIVNYHYIGNESDYPNPGIHPISPERFLNQLNLLKNDFVFVSEEEVLKAIRGEKELPKFACLITFDDGLLCQFEIACPILKKLAVPAIFFVNSLPFNGEPLLIHKLHYIRANTKPTILWEKIKRQYEYFTKEAFDENAFKFTTELWKKHYPYDNDFDSARVKYILGRDTLPVSLQNFVINNIFLELEPDKKSFIEKYYMNEEHLKELSRFGNGIGIHTHSHLPGPLLTQKNTAKLEVENCYRYLDGFLPGKIHGISYPYGDVVPAVIKASQSLGLEYGMTLEQSFNENLIDPFLLARADTNDAPGGKDPKIKIDSGSVTILKTDFKLTRGRYKLDGKSDFYR